MSTQNEGHPFQPGEAPGLDVQPPVDPEGVAEPVPPKKAASRKRKGSNADAVTEAEIPAEVVDFPVAPLDKTVPLKTQRATVKTAAKPT